MPMSAPQRGISSSHSSMFGRIGSGLTPPKNGLRSVCISRTVSRPSPMSLVYQPAPAPYRFSTSTRCSAARILVLGMLEHRGLDRVEHFRRGGAAGIGLDLEAVVGPRVVAGGDHDSG